MIFFYFTIIIKALSRLRLKPATTLGAAIFNLIWQDIRFCTERPSSDLITWRVNETP